MLAASVKQFVFSSTCATYGVPKSAIQRPSPNPINPYGTTKLMVERILQILMLLTI